MYYTYVLKSLRDGRWYTGQSNDLRTRVKEHNKGRVESTRTDGLYGSFITRHV